jgi:hypothetical protein
LELARAADHRAGGADHAAADFLILRVRADDLGAAPAPTAADREAGETAGFETCAAKRLILCGRTPQRFCSASFSQSLVIRSR